MDFLTMCLIVCPLIFIGCFVDSIAGGGGIITLPAYLMVGLPVHLAAGTNKVVASCGSVTASIKFFRGKSVLLSVAAFAAGGSLLGGALGSRLALFVSENVLSTIILVSLPAVAVFLMVKRDFGKDPKKRDLPFWATAVLSSIIGLIMGMYDGLVGPGTGTFLIIAFTGLLGLDLLTSSGCARVANMASNIAAMTVFILNDSVYWPIVIPAALCSIAGGYFGVKYALKGGSKNVRKVMFVVLALLFINMGYDFLVS